DVVVVLDQAAIAEEQVIARGRLGGIEARRGGVIVADDRILAAAAEGDVIAGGAFDVIIAVGIEHVRDDEVAAEDVVDARVAVTLGHQRAANFVADKAIATDDGIARLAGEGREVVVNNQAVVAEEDVRAILTQDSVIVGTTEDDVLASA